jgi:hypothetical protein
MTRSTSIIASQPGRRAPSRTAGSGARSWTGRSVVTSATERVQPRHVTVDMHRSRVSGIRHLVSRADVVRSVLAPSAAATNSGTRRHLITPLISG